MQDLATGHVLGVLGGYLLPGGCGDTDTLAHTQRAQPQPKWLTATATATTAATSNTSTLCGGMEDPDAEMQSLEWTLDFGRWDIIAMPAEPHVRGDCVLCLLEIGECQMACACMRINMSLLIRLRLWLAGSTGW
jgi:hypothetical protein